MSRIWRGGLTIAVGLVILALPRPAAVTGDAWLLLAIFGATIAGLILQPLPMGAVVILGVTAAAVSGAVPLSQALAGFANGTVWLIVIAFLFARAFILTGLGRRVAFLLIRALGSRTLSLAYSIALADLAIAPATPSNTARAGGILFPIVRSLAAALGSEPGPSARRAGAFLITSAYHCNVVTSAMFMTAMAANPLAVELARESAGVQLSWGGWAVAALVPGLISLVLTPLVLYRLYPPEITRTPEAAALAEVELARLGPVSSKEKMLLGVFLVVLVLWATAQLHPLNATTVAFIGLSALLVGGVLPWEAVIREHNAWDALVWFGGLVTLAGQLSAHGVIAWFVGSVASGIGAWPWQGALIGLLLVYLYTHYAFASMTAHVTAMYPAFLAVAIATGAPPVLAAVTLAFFSNINASLTHYAAGPAPIYFGSGYVDLATWWRLGLAVSVVNVVVWLGVGFPYWKLLGLW